MLAEVLFFGIVIYLIYKVLFDFILPVSHAGKQMRQQFRDMNEHMRQQQQNNYQEQNNHQNTSTRKAEKVEGDYIDFEEVKK
ncbi:MAG: DUF4834 family protein [Bacteroidetes bacterium]|nr:DUF4834 family protein [Bacteroidota bacterium]